MSIEFTSIDNNVLSLMLSKVDADDSMWKYELLDQDGVNFGYIVVVNGKDIKLESKSDAIRDDDDEIQVKLGELLHSIIDAENSGLDSFSESQQNADNPYNPDDIKVRNDKMPITLISTMIEAGDIDMNPDFQRHLVWDSKQKSRLIESILLRIPLPMFYFSEDKEGKLIIVDGLQRISTIYDFMHNRFPLQNLQYLQDSCGGRYYSSDGAKKGIDSKYFRWFNMTTISANIIDPSSPSKVKYDIFRRINTGGRTLNNQEIRNCLTGKTLREALKSMTESKLFRTATDGSIKSKRMDDQEIALRFLMFYKIYEDSARSNIDAYSGYMEQSLDNYTESFSKVPEGSLDNYINKFNVALENSQYLIGPKYAFRKILLDDLRQGAYKQLINKALFVCTMLLLADYDCGKIAILNEQGSLTKPLAEKIQKDKDFYSYLSYGTNGWKNLTYVFNELKTLFESVIRYE